MSESTKHLLVDLGIGLAAVVLSVLLMDPFSAETTADMLRILSDAFFLAAVLLLASGGLTFTKNGGVWDGLGFTFKQGFARMKGNYEEKRFTFADYREERERKNKSPWSALISGAVYLIIALVFLFAYEAVI